MKKVFLVLFIVLVFSSLALGQTDPQIVEVGMANTSGGGGDGSITPGATVYVEAVGNGSGGTLQSGIHDNGSSTNNKLYIYYYSDTPPSTYKTYEEVTASNFSVNTNTIDFQFTMPTHGSSMNGTASIEIYFGLVGSQSTPPPPSTNYGTALLSYSGLDDAPSNYDSYLTYSNDTSTEAPTLDSPSSNCTIEQDFDIVYDQPETAYDGTVKITFTRTAGSTDDYSPHVLEVLSETSGTDITISLDGSDLGGASEVSLDSGGNSLVNDAIYTIKIEYQDIAQNAAASDQNSGITYDDSGLLEVSGGDYQAGSSYSPGSINNCFFYLQMRKSKSGEFVTVDSIRFDLTGAFGSADIDAIKVWTSSESTFDDGSRAATLLYTDNTSPFSPVYAEFSQNVNVGQSYQYFYLTVDVDEGATTTNEIGAEIDTKNYISSSHTVTGSFPIEGGDHPLPVTLSSFTVEYQQKPVLNWVTHSETENAYWNIYRGISTNMGQAIWINDGDIIEGQGTTTTPTEYYYTDEHSIEGNATYWYWLECIDLAGNGEFLGPIELNIPEGGGNNGTPATPDDFGLQQNYPNPFNPDTIINFALPEASNVNFNIYNTKGEKVKTVLINEFIPAEEVQTIHWNGTNNEGKAVSSGVYLYELQTENKNYVKKMLLVK